MCSRMFGVDGLMVCCVASKPRDPTTIYLNYPSSPSAEHHTTTVSPGTPDIRVVVRKSIRPYMVVVEHGGRCRDQSQPPIGLKIHVWRHMDTHSLLPL